MRLQDELYIKRTEELHRVTHYLNTPIIKLERQIRILQLDYDADFKTLKELKQTEKLEKLKNKFKEKHTNLKNKLEQYEKEVKEYVKNQMLKDKSSMMHVSKMQLFMDTLKELEGPNKKAVLHQTLVRELVDGKRAFSREQANEYIRKMLHEASIYESKLGFYNRVWGLLNK